MTTAHEDDALRRALERALDELTPTQEELAGVGELALERILARVQSGRRPDGQPFAPYALSTRRQRARRGLSTSSVNLSETGAMLASLAARVTGEAVRIAPLHERERIKLSAHQRGARHLPSRPVLDLSDEDIEALATSLSEHMSQRMTP